MRDATFDLRHLFDVIESRRRRLGVSQAALSGEVGVAPGTIRRFGVADDAEADGVLALVRWCDVPPEQFVVHGTVPGERLAVAGDRIVRVDMVAVATASRNLRRFRGRNRTTIQTLVSVAQYAEVSVASLTRLSAT